MTIEDVRHAIGRVSRGEPERNPIDYAQHWAVEAAEAELSRARPEARPTRPSAFPLVNTDQAARLREENAHLRRLLQDEKGRPRTKRLIRDDEGRIVAVREE
jgi:hypothetical protein